MMEKNEVVLNSMPNSWSKQAHVQGFDCESITFEKAVNIFECMKIAKSIYKIVVEPSYKQSNRENDIRYGYIRLKR